MWLSRIRIRIEPILNHKHTVAVCCVMSGLLSGREPHESHKKIKRRRRKNTHMRAKTKTK